MNEGRTTAIFAAVAVVTLGLAWWSRPEAISDESDLKRERTGQPVFVKFEDPAEAASFQIVKYDEELGQLERFEVAKDKTSNMWKLPSYDDYPADAAEQVRDATTPLISLPILNVTSLDRGDHSLYGVVNPDEEGLTVGESGVGMLLRVKDNMDQVLAELIVGKAVEGTENQRYVRIPSEDAVYVVEINPTSFTTDFQKWINQELLEIRNFDISNVGLRDYAILPTQNGYGMSRNFDADLSYDSAANKWSLDKLVTYESGKAVEDSLDEEEQLSETALNDLRNAVQDLKIVNVRRKPKGLAADLKADKSLMENKESLQSLVSQGFIPQEGPNGTEIYATGGETLVGTESGVKYLLRFGESVAKIGGDEAGELEESGLRRYLLISATLDEAKFPPPDLEPLPETVEEMLARQKEAESPEPPAAESPSDVIEVPPTPTPEASDSSDKAPAPETPAPETPAQEADNAEKSDADNAEADNADAEKADTEATPAEQAEPSASDADVEESEATTSDALELNDCGPQEPQAEAAESQPPAADDADTAAEETAEPAPGEVAEPSDAAPPAPEKPQSPATDASDEPAAEAKPADEAKPAKTQEELQEELEFVREQVAKENQRKIDERNEKLDAARKRVRELNARFADWYYVVSDNVYKKLKVSRDQLIVKKGATPPAGNLQPGNLPPANLPPGGFQFGP